MSPAEARLRALAARRWKIAITLTVAMVFVYFGFIALIAFDKPRIARLVAPGLSLGILLGVVVIVASWLLTWAYVHWANTRYDTELRKVRDLGTPSA